jgi:hypothetical protein
VDTTYEIYADVAKFQALLDGTYPRKFVMFRLVNEFGNIDPHAAANIATALAMRRRGQLVNFGGYINPGHVANSTMLAALRQLDFPADAQIMLDVEAWPDKDTGVPLIAGDHSTGFNVLAAAIRTRQGGRADLVTAYGNRHDLAALWRTRPAWLGLVIAGYNTNDPRDEFEIVFAWQYTNGVENHTPWPQASEPFGPCDHNRLYLPIPSPNPEDDMPTARELWEAPITNTLVDPDGTTTDSAERWLLRAVSYAHTARDEAAAADAKIAAVLEALSQLGGGAGVIDYARVQQAAEDAATAVIERTHLAVG